MPLIELAERLWGLRKALQIGWRLRIEIGRGFADIAAGDIGRDNGLFSEA